MKLSANVKCEKRDTLEIDVVRFVFTFYRRDKKSCNFSCNVLCAITVIIRYIHRIFCFLFYTNLNVSLVSSTYSYFLVHVNFASMASDHTIAPAHAAFALRFSVISVLLIRLLPLRIVISAGRLLTFSLC